MQARALACVAIVAVLRLLNLAIPILYRDVINTLASASELTHPRDGKAPQTFTFKQVCNMLVLVQQAAHHLMQRWTCAVRRATGSHGMS